MKTLYNSLISALFNFVYSSTYITINSALGELIFSNPLSALLQFDGPWVLKRTKLALTKLAV